MRALVYGVRPDRQPEPATDNPLLRGLARTPARLQDVPEPAPPSDEWCVLAPRLTGICGSDSKQFFMDFGVEGDESPMSAYFSLPQVLGHEVVADVVSAGAAVDSVREGDRVVLNPWLTCRPRGVSPACPNCAAGDLSMCWSFAEGPLAPGIHIGTSSDLPGGYADRMLAHESMLHEVPDGVPDELAVSADPFAVSLHSVTRHPPRPGGKVLVYGAGALGTCAVAAVRALFPDVDVAVVARFPAQAELARKLGASLVVEPEPRLAVIEAVAQWSGGRLLPCGPQGLPMAHPGGVDVVYDTIGKAETYEVGVRVLREHGTLVQSGVHGSARWEATPLYFKQLTFTGSNAFGIEEVDGVRKHGIAHYLDLAAAGGVDLTGMLTHAYPLEEWRRAFTTIATQGDTGAIKVAFDFRGNST